MENTAGAAQGKPAWMESERKLEQFLESHGVDTKKFGKGSAKSLAHLQDELRTEACYLEVQHNAAEPPSQSGRKRGKVIRVVEPVFIRLCWRTKVLVQESQRFPDGRMRNRKMLIAEKKEPSDGGGLLTTVIRAMCEELGLDAELLRQEGMLQYRTDAYHFEMEQIESPSYPGLASLYRTHHVQVDILEGGMELFKGCGLPACVPFQTEEMSALGTVTHFWKWYDTAEALQQGVVKFPPPKLSSSPVHAEDAEVAGIWNQ